MSVLSVKIHILRRLRRICIECNQTTQYIDSLIVSLYVYNNHCIISNNKLLQNYLLPQSDNNLNSLLQILDELHYRISIEDVVSLFEYVISPQDKDVNGAIYTPLYIREYICQEILNNWPVNQWSYKKIADISCGCGGFFITLAKMMHEAQIGSYYQIYKNIIYGVDIMDYSIQRTKLLMTLLAVSEHEDVEQYEFNLYVADSLRFNWSDNSIIRLHGGFDAIVGNPPYISSSKMSEETKQCLKRWSVSRSGKSDMYIPFFQIAIENLKENGILGYITVNNFYRSMNGCALRHYLSERQYYLKLIDFGSEQVFVGRSTYTCLCFIKKKMTSYIDYCATSSHNLCMIEKQPYNRIKYHNLSDDNGWILRSKTEADFIYRIEHTGEPLGKRYMIRNGFATLKNDIYLFKPLKEDDCFYYFIKDNKLYKIEKSVCRDAVKANIIRGKDDLNINIQKLIYPYKTDGQKITTIDEPEFCLKFPYAYQYLKNYIHVLSQRDKGKRRYEQWYAYGRTQAINIKGYKLLFPYIADKPYFVVSDNKELLYYNGYAVVSDSIDELLLLHKVLSSNIFWQYIQLTSKPYSASYFALAKNYVKKFGIPNFSEKEKDILRNLESQNEIDEWLQLFY